MATEGVSFVWSLAVEFDSLEQLAILFLHKRLLDYSSIVHSLQW